MTHELRMNAAYLRASADTLEPLAYGSNTTVVVLAQNNLRLMADMLEHLNDRALLAQMAAELHASGKCGGHVDLAVRAARAILTEIDKGTK
jgi:hypothetical protein